MSDYVIDKSTDPLRWFKEETAELIAASEAMSKADVLNEAVDVLYTLVLLCQKHGISQDQVLMWHAAKSEMREHGVAPDEASEFIVCTSIAFGYTREDAGVEQ